MTETKNNTKYNLTPNQNNRILKCQKSKVNFISGTVSPAQSARNVKSSNYVKEDIESLEVGLKYLLESYGDDLSLSIQPKFMGSRFNMYLFKNDINSCYCVTRSGVYCTLPRCKLEPLYKIMTERLNKFMTENKIKMIILDGELLPWSALGKGLIEDDFLPVDKGLEIEIEMMKKYDFDTQLKKIKTKYEEIDKFINNDSKSNAIKKFGKDKITDYEKNQELLSIQDTKTMEKLYTTFHDQMTKYAGYDIKYDINNKNKDIELSYKAFGILKICYDDGTEAIPLLDQTYSQSEMYEIVSDSESKDDNQLIITGITKDNFKESYQKIKKYYDNLTYDKGFEGIVIKPEYIEKGKLPLMKCRNTSYLTIIYGYDYMIEPKLSRLIKSKSTSNKIRQSIKEFELGMEMLKIEYEQIEMSDDYYGIVAKILFNEHITNKLDPRL